MCVNVCPRYLDAVMGYLVDEYKDKKGGVRNWSGVALVLPVCCCSRSLLSGVFVDVGDFLS